MHQCASTIITIVVNTKVSRTRVYGSDHLLEILTALDDWSACYDKFSNLDVYYSQEYLMASLAQAEDATAFAIYFESRGAKIWYPFLLRPIPERPEYTDIVTAYGYGGPHLEGNESCIIDFYEEFVNSFCRQHQVVTETVRLHPLTKNHLVVQRVMDIIPVRKTISVDLTSSYEDIMLNYSSTRRAQIRGTLKKYDLQFHCYKHADAVDEFMKLYNSSMDRKQASSQYYFDRSYFLRLMKGSRLFQPQMLFVSYEGTMIHAKLNLIGNKYGHGHLSGTDAQYIYLRPDAVLMDYSIRMAKEAGATQFHVGGGYQEDDGIYRFKASFTKGRFIRYYIGKHILNQEIYDEIINELNINPSDYPDYFPVYRHPSVKRLA